MSLTIETNAVTTLTVTHTLSLAGDDQVRVRKVNFVSARPTKAPIEATQSLIVLQPPAPRAASMARNSAQLSPLRFALFGCLLFAALRTRQNLLPRQRGLSQ